VRRGFSSRIEGFRPEALFWNWGYDGTKGEYGDVGLTPDFHVLLAKELKAAAEKISQGRLIVVLCGGSRRDLARALIPRITDVLAGE